MASRQLSYGFNDLGGDKVPETSFSWYIESEKFDRFQKAHTDYFWWSNEQMRTLHQKFNELRRNRVDSVLR